MPDHGGFLGGSSEPTDQRAPRDVATFFEGLSHGVTIYTAVVDAVAQIGPSTVRVTANQIAFVRGERDFAYLWRPDYSRGDVTVMLSVVLPAAANAERPTVVPAPTRWLRQVPLRNRFDVDYDVVALLEAAYQHAG